MIKAAFALLTDYHTHNTVRQFSVAVDRRFSIGAAILPPHVSLKQPFVVEDLVGVEAYFDELAADLAPMHLWLSELGVWAIPGPGDSQTGVLYVVAEDALLGSLHQRLNKELAERFENTQAPFDGDEYRFHMTLSMGGASAAVYQQAYEQYAAAWRPIKCRVNEVVMFYHDDSSPSGEFTTYKILPLGGHNRKAE